MKFGINRYIGDWLSGDGLRLRIDKIDEPHATVSLFGSAGKAMHRPFWNERPTQAMQADYDEYMGEFTVQLWESRRFCLHLDHHLSDRFADLDQEVLSPSLSRREEDHFLDAAYPMFGNLQDYKRTGRQNQSIHVIGAAAPQRERSASER